MCRIFQSKNKKSFVFLDKLRHLQHAFQKLVSYKFQLTNLHGSSREEKEDNLGKLGRLEKTVSDFDEKLEVTKCLLEKIQEKLYDFDVNKKNNLIFNGIKMANGEDAAKLTVVVQDIIKTKLNILRFIDIVVTILISTFSYY